MLPCATFSSDSGIWNVTFFPLPFVPSDSYLENPIDHVSMYTTTAIVYTPSETHSTMSENDTLRRFPFAGLLLLLEGPDSVVEGAVSRAGSSGSVSTSVDVDACRRGGGTGRVSSWCSDEAGAVPSAGGSESISTGLGIGRGLKPGRSLSPDAAAFDFCRGGRTGRRLAASACAGFGCRPGGRSARSAMSSSSDAEGWDSG